MLLLLLLGTAFTFVWTMLNRDRLRFKWYIAAPLAILHTIVGVAAVLAFAQLEHIGQSVPFGTLSLFGAIFVLPLFYFLLAKLSKRRMADVFDVFTVSMVFTLLCARVNCLFAGCCLGKLLSGTDGVRWPTRELELVFYAVILAVFIARLWKKKSCGELFPLYMVCYGVFRFVIEFFREAVPATDSPLHISHLWAALSACIGLSIYYEIKRKHLDNEKKHPKKSGGQTK